VVLGGSSDNEHSKLGCRREHPDLRNLPIWNFADPDGRFAQSLGVLTSPRAWPCAQPSWLIRSTSSSTSLSPTSTSAARPADTLRALDALQTDELCACKRAVGGETLQAA
jgi:alkyl hydroperoxide reductase subunit AhpC